MSKIVTPNKPNTQIYTGRMSFLLRNQQCQSTEEKSITFHGLSHLKLTWRSSVLFLTTKRILGYFVEELTELSVPYLFFIFLAAVQDFYCGPLWYYRNVIMQIFSLIFTKYFPLDCGGIVQAQCPRNLMWHRMLLIFLF